jgi:hypothetical protein
LMTLNSAHIGPAIDKAAKTRGRFLRAAHNLILGLAPEPSLWSLARAWVLRSRVWTRSRAGIVLALTPRPTPPPPGPAAPPQPPPPAPLPAQPGPPQP